MSNCYIVLKKITNKSIINYLVKNRISFTEKKIKQSKNISYNYITLYINILDLDDNIFNVIDELNIHFEIVSIYLGGNFLSFEFLKKIIFEINKSDFFENKDLLAEISFYLNYNKKQVDILFNLNFFIFNILKTLKKFSKINNIV